MPPKAAKKGSAKKPNAAGAAVVKKNWEVGLSKEQFEEDSWQASVSFVVGRTCEDEELIQALASAVQRPQRKLFTLLTWDDTLAKIHELGNPKTKKSDDGPLYYEVTEPAKLLLDAGEEIPCDLMAKILKFQLLQIKANDQQRREDEQAVDDKARDSLSSAGKEKGGAKVSDKKGKNTPQPVEPPKEKKTKLKRRDEVDPPKLKDDEPDDGPQHYILVLGFYQPELIGIFDTIGVHVSNVITLCSEDRQTCEVQEEQHISEDNEQSQRTSPGLDADSVSVEQAGRAKNLDLFWSGLRPVLDCAPLNSKLHNVAILSYTVPDILPSSHSQDTEAVLELGGTIFDGVARLIYDCLDWRRQHQHYLDNIKLINVPTVVGVDFQPIEVVPTSLPRTPQSKKKSVEKETPLNREIVPPPLSTDVDMRYYSSLLNLVPPEACSVSLILHCMLEQVVISTEQSVTTRSDVAEKPKPHDGPWLNCQLISHMLQSFMPLVHTDEEKCHMLNNLLMMVQNEEDKERLVKKFAADEPQKKSDNPLVIRHHDERTLRLRDKAAVQSFDPVEVELSMMKLSPVWKLIHSVAHPRKSNTCWMAVRQQLQHYCTDDAVPWPKVERLFHQSVFEAMPLTSLDQNGVLQRRLEPDQQQTPTIIPWDNPLSYAKQQLHNLQTKGLLPFISSVSTFLTDEPGNTEQLGGKECSHVDLSDIQNCRLRSLFDWHYAEHHDTSVFPQVLQLASEEYRCLDTFRGNQNNILYIFCHNPTSLHYNCKELWDVALHTDVKFRTYLEHVADKISDWTKEEELKWEAMQLRSISHVESPEEEKATDCADKMEEEVTLEPVIRKGSLKAWKLEQEQLKEEEAAKKSKKDNTPKGKQPKGESTSADNKKSKSLSGDKKSRAGSADSSVVTSKEPIPTEEPPVQENEVLQETEEHFNAFTGYSMDQKLIHVSGGLQYLYPSDGGQIIVENIHYVGGSNLMKVAVKKDGHYFYTHINQVIIDPPKPPPQPHDIENNETKEGTAFPALKPVEVKRMKQGSLSAVLNNGIHLSYSFYGPTGEFLVNPQEAEVGIAHTSTVAPIPLSSSTQRSKGTDVDSDPSKTTSIQSRPPESQSEVCGNQPALSSKPFNSLTLSVPNGLLLQFMREDSQGVSSEEQGVLVRQSFPLHCRGEVMQLQDPSLSKELSRIITSQGTVIRLLRDRSTEVLFADGSVSFSQDCGPVWVPDSELEEEISPHETEDSSKEQSSGKAADAQRGCWLTTTPSGARICTVGTTHKHIPTTPLLTFKATDPITNEVMLTREDLVVSVQSPDGSLSVEHADGTRITTLYQDRPPNTGEQADSVIPKATSECACGCTECVCVTHHNDTIDENMHTQDTCDTGEENSRDDAGKAYDKEDFCTGLNEYEDMCSDLEGAENILDKNNEESVLAEETMGENGKRSASESDKGSVSTKERVVLVEKEGCATVVMYPERHMAHVFLADRTVITGNNQGAYEVFPSNAGVLLIQSNGKCVYSSEPLVTPSQKGGTPTDQPGCYTFSHADKVACAITDPDGNRFQVMEDGQVSLLNFSPAPSTLKQDEEELEEEDREVATLHGKQSKHCPRLFMVHEDGSGTELLSSETVEELLFQVYSDPTTAVLKEPLPEMQDEFGVTIIKPSHESVWSQWILGKQNPDITPPNLRNRSWHDFPRVEKKSPGPPFGTNMGRGLTLREQSGVSSSQHQPVRNCPKVLEIRELYEHRPLTMPLKNTIDARLKEYIESLIEREQRSEAMKVKDPRTEEESVSASDLLNMVLSFAEEEDAAHNICKRTSVDIGTLYNQGIGAQAEQSDVSEDSASVASESFSNGKESKWTERLAQHRQELCEEKACKVDLRTKNIVPYFHPENISLYQDLLQNQIPDMRSLSMALPPIPKSDSAEAFLRDAPQESTPRPLNPTPSQSASHVTGSDKTPERRPTNPTPQTAGESSLRGSSGPYKSVQVDVTGKPRMAKVRLPPCILSSKPSSVPNQQFLEVEEPVRRKCRTTSLTHPDVVVRGFQLLPTSVDFGTLQEGTCSTITVVMKNVGVDTCRFHVKQPPSDTGLRVLYNPGPVAAGLQVDLHVQLFAMFTAKAGEEEPKKYISQDIVIHTETDILYLPVTVTILPERLYDIWLKDHTSAHKKKDSRGTKVSSSLQAGPRVKHRRPSTLPASPAAKTGYNHTTSK